MVFAHGLTLSTVDKPPYRYRDSDNYGSDDNGGNDAYL